MSVVYLDNIIENNPINIGDISIYFNDSFIFIGPMRKENASCFNCFVDRVKEQELYAYYLIENKTKKLNPLEETIIDEYVKDIKDINNSIIYIFNRNTKEVEKVSTFKRGDCPSCKEDKIQYKNLHAPSKKFDKNNPRQESWKNVVKKLDDNKELVYKNKF